jgi:hypothetical protein
MIARARWMLAGLFAVAAGPLAVTPAAAQCSVFHRGPCIPDFGTPLPQDLRLTIESKAAAAEPATSGQSEEPPAEQKLNTIRAMFDALRACWVPPDEDEARSGMQMSVRFAFKRNGELIAPPRVTYTTPAAPQETSDIYRKAITAALERCTPLHFTEGMGGAIAGKPIAIRFVDNRTLQRDPNDAH